MATATMVDLAGEVRRIRSLASSSTRTEAELNNLLVQIYRALFDTDLERFDVATVRAAAPLLMAEIFDMRMELRDRIPEWHNAGLMTIANQKALRDAFRAARYAADMMGEINIGHIQFQEGDEHLRAFSGNDFNTLAHPAFEAGHHLPFQSGDVILVRGMAHNSAAIARIGDIDSQFSHMSLVYIDDKGRHWTVEALIEEGGIVHPLEEALHHNLGRAIVFRFKDPSLARKAAQIAYDRVRKSRTAWHRRIHYDFSMRLEPYGRMFCSKLIRYAYDMASNGLVKLPTFTTRLDAKNRDFFDRIGVEAVETFAPGDIEIDPLFHLVAEWQDYRITSSLRMQDLLMTKLFEWMDVYGYKFEQDFTIRLIGFFGKLSSYLSDEAKDFIASVVPKVPVVMKRKTIAAIAMLHQTAEPLHAALKRLEVESIARTGRPLHPRDVYVHLERMRAASGDRIGYLVKPD